LVHYKILIFCKFTLLKPYKQLYYNILIYRTPLKSNIADIYGGICTEKYYDRALSIVDKSISDNKQYIFFSDDPDYVREHYSIPNIIIVDWNNGEDSFMDMYLMSKCKYMILANSTFSYWSAMFNKTKRMVICPSKWNNLNFPDITQSEWIQIEM
ncbi:alpha-1,2-fucosyltransferase, partial [Phocaeicola dorei]